MVSTVDGAPANLMVVISTDTQLVLSWTLVITDMTIIEFRVSWRKDGGSFTSSAPLLLTLLATLL